MISDRNLSVGTTLWAKHKGQTYTAEVVEGEGGIRYRLADGREFKSPSAAGTTVTGKSCNGWAFWTVGEPASVAPSEPKPKRSRKSRAKPDVSGAPPNPTLPIVQTLDDQYECGECGSVFPTSDEVAQHLEEAHAVA